jgi:hypothetical protein
MSDDFVFDLNLGARDPRTRLVAAAQLAASWIRARRASWAAEQADGAHPAAADPAKRPTAESAPVWTGRER